MLYKLLEELLPIAGWTDEDMSQITIIGQDPLVHTRFKIGETFAAVQAACGLAAAKLWELRTGHKQHVTVDVSEAIAGLGSFMYTRVTDAPPEPNKKISEAAALLASGIAFTNSYMTRDGRWFYIHASTDPRKMLNLLGCEGNKESVGKVIANRDAKELEDSFLQNGLNGCIVRSSDEWLATEQGKLLSQIPVVEINKIAETAPIPLLKGNRPLSGVRALDLTRILAGPTASRTLAEHGGDVLWVGAEHLADYPVFTLDTGHGKRRTFLDLRTQEGIDKLWGLIGQADVFGQSYRLGTKMGQEFSFEAVAKQRPGIIYTHINAFGQKGPWSKVPGWEQLAQAATGIQLEEGKYPCAPVDPDGVKMGGLLYLSFHQPQGQPRILCGAFCDYTSGYLTAFATMVALYRRATEGGSYLINTSLAQSAMALIRMGLVDETEAMSKSDIVPTSLINKMTIEEYGPSGHLQYLSPIIHMSETPPYYKQPTVPLGSSESVWLAL
ncbi:MAG: CoA transferase [Dehalococcoidia bacterium]